MKMWDKIKQAGAGLSVVALLLVGGFTAVPKAAAQTTYGAPSYDTWNSGVSIAGTGISTQNVAKAVNNATVYAFQVTAFGASAAATNALTLTFDEAAVSTNDWISGTKTSTVWSTGTRTMTITPSGTTTVNVTSNFTINASRWLRLATISNADNATNVTVRVLGGPKNTATVPK